MTFEEWWEDTFGYGDYGNPPNEAIDAWNAAWQAATLAERERAAKVAESNIPAPPTQWGKGAAFNAEKIAAAIRKGEGV